MRYIILAVAVIAAVSSCQKSEIWLCDSSSNAIRFDTYIGVTTKGNILDQTKLRDGFGVLVYQQGYSDFGASSTPNLLYNEMVYGTYEDDGSTFKSWTYDDTQYWSDDSSQRYSFFGYSPYNGDLTSTNGSITLSGVDTPGAPTARVTLATEAECMIDFIAGQVVNTTKYGGMNSSYSEPQLVNMYFKHQLTRVSFSAQAVSDVPGITQTYINVKSLRLLGTNPKVQDVIKYGETTVAVGSPYDDAYASDALYTTATYTFDTKTSIGTSEDHSQDGVWSSASAVEESYDMASILAKGTPASQGFPSNKKSATDTGDDRTGADIVYTTEGVLVQCSNEIPSEATQLFVSEDSDSSVKAQYLFLIPPVTTVEGEYTTGIVEDKTSIKVEIIYDVVTQDDNLEAGYIVTSEENLAIVEIPEGTLKQGFAYDFLLNITGSSIVDPTLDPEDSDTPELESAFDAVEINGKIEDWETGESVETFPMGVGDSE